MLHNFALIRHGETVVHDVIVATDEFWNDAAEDWRNQWEHVVNVDGVPCGPGWSYDVATGSFSPPEDTQ